MLMFPFLSLCLFSGYRIAPAHCTGTSSLFAGDWAYLVEKRRAETMSDCLQSIVMIHELWHVWQLAKLSKLQPTLKPHHSATDSELAVGTLKFVPI